MAHLSSYSYGDWGDDGDSLNLDWSKMTILDELDDCELELKLFTNGTTYGVFRDSSDMTCKIQDLDWFDNEQEARDFYENSK